MRRTLRAIGLSFWSIYLVNLGFNIIDWTGRWEWFEVKMAEHPLIASFIRTPFVYLALLVLGFLLLRAENQLKRPHLVAKFLNFRITPNRATTPVSAYFFEEKGRQLTWDCFVEVQLANDADVATTLEGVEAYFRAKQSKWKPWKVRRFAVRLMDDVSLFRIDRTLDKMGQPHDQRFEGDDYLAVPSLLEEVKGKPLERGIGYRGWIRFQMDAAEIEWNREGMLYDVWLVDALGGKHKLDYKKGEDSQWESNFYIHEMPHVTRRQQ